MRTGLLFLLAAHFITPAGAQTAATEGEAHILSAFTTRVDPRVLAPEVNVGPMMREQLGARTDIYAALVEQTMGKRLRVTVLPPDEAARYTSISGFTAGAPVMRLDAGELSLLMQYAAKEKAVMAVEQISAPQAAVQAAPKPPQPVVELPPAPPAPPAVEAAPLAAPPVVIPPVAAPPVVPPVVAAPKPAPAVVAPKPAPAAAVPKPVPAVAAPAVAATPRTPPKPRGDCVIKPVMSEQDMWNCSGPGRSTPMLAAPAVDVEASPAAPPALAAPPECVIKPVMSEEDLRICAAASRQSRPRITAPVEATPATAAPGTPATLQAPPPQCAIKPVMTEEDLRICAAASRQARPAVTETAAQPVALEKAQPAAPAAPPAPRECVIKPVMSEAELRACGVRRLNSGTEP